MDPILRVIDYMFKKKDQLIHDETINSFFNNGISFPQFVAISLNIESIPDIIPNPKTSLQKNINNNFAYHYLIQNNRNIAKSDPPFSSLKDKTNLLKLMLTKQCFNINYEEIITICNIITQPLSIEFKTINDILNIKTMISILNVLTDGKVSNDSNSNFDQLIIQSFEKVKVPLVIDKTCLEIQNNYLFLIQYEVIFDFFHDKITKLKTSQQKSILKQQLPIENNISKCFIDIIRRIFDKNTNNQSLDFLFDYYNFQGFVNYVLKNDQNYQISISKNINNNIISKESQIESLINYLCSIDPKFETLELDFINPFFCESSLKLLYINMLDIFFLKQTKEELYERCYTILYSKINSDNKFYQKYEDKDKILCRYMTYYSLIIFSETGKIILDPNSLSSLPNSIIIKSASLMIFDKKKLSHYPKSERFLLNTNLFYYQLQIIFDKLDSTHHVLIEFFLVLMRKIKQIKIPSYEKMLKNIRAKNISLILQIKRQKEMKKKVLNNNTDKNVYLDSDKTEIPLVLKTYADRQTEQINNIQDEEKIKKSFKTHDRIDYWELTDKVYSFDKGIFYNVNLDKKKVEKGQDIYEESIYYYKKKVKKRTSANSMNLPCFEVAKSKNIETRLYKFFYYDKESDKWRYDSDVFGNFLNDNLRILGDNIKTPLVLLFNSKEEQSRKFCSKLIIHSIPKIEKNDDEIYIYGLLGLPLSMLNFEFNTSLDLSLISPIYLLLHGPDDKVPSYKYGRIFYQILVFLFFISDLKILILDKFYSGYQFSTFNVISSIIDSNFAIYNHKKKINSNNQTEKNDDAFDLEGFEGNSRKNRLLTLFDNNSIKKSVKFIFLYDHREIIGNTQKVIKPPGFKEEEDIHDVYININDSFTYNSFLDSFNSLLNRNTGQLSTVQDIKMNFHFISLFVMSTSYLFLRDNEDKLKEKIVQRYRQFKDEHLKNMSGFFIISLLKNELINTFPMLDREYADKCHSILSELIKENSQDKMDFIKSELKISSKNSLIYLKEMVKNAQYLTNAQINNLKTSHINFLREEFFNIIKFNYQPEIIPVIFQDNEKTLLDQIKLDSDNFVYIFKEIEEKIKIKNTEQYVEIENGTNYTIRERENEREIKVRVELKGNLESLIPPDF